MSVVTNDVPMLLPMLRMKLSRPAAFVFFSGGSPTYAASVIGTNSSGSPAACRMRSQRAVSKLIVRSSHFAEMNIDPAISAQPNATR